jgi:hypothetical protein
MYMIERIIDICKKEKIESYKIVKTMRIKEEYSYIFQKEQHLYEEETTYLLRFQWEGLIREILVEKELDGISDLVKITKLLPGINYRGENFNGLEIKKDVLKYEKQFDPIIERLHMYAKEWKEKYNLVVQRQVNFYTLAVSKSAEYMNQVYYKNTVNYLNTERYKSIFYSFDNETEWDLLQEKLNNSLINNVFECPIIQEAITGNIVFEPIVISKILKLIAEYFHADRVYKNQSLISVADLGKKLFDDDIDLYSKPIQNLIYDSEGNPIQKKYLIREGCICSLLSNSICTTKIDGIFPGEADMFDNARITTPDMILNTKKIYIDKYESLPKVLDIKISNFQNDMKHISGDLIINYNGKVGKQKVNLDIKSLLNSMRQISCEKQWSDGVYTTSMVCVI